MPFSERLCCTCLGVRPRLVYDKPLNCVPLTQFTRNGLGDAKEHFAPGWKLPCHLTSRDQRGKINYPQWCQVETLHGHKALNIQTQILYDWRSFQCKQKQLGKKDMRWGFAGSSKEWSGLQGRWKLPLTEDATWQRRPHLHMNAAALSDLGLDTMPGRAHAAGERGQKDPWTSWEPTPGKNPGAKRDDFSKVNTVQSHRQHRAKIFKLMRLDTDSVSTTPVAEKFSMWLTWVKFCFAAGL